MIKCILLFIPLIFFTPPQDPPIDLTILMHTIRIMESSDGQNCISRYEPSFLENYGDKSFMPYLRDLYGDKPAASSYGCYQIMLCVAWENEWRYSPEELSESENNERVAKDILRKYIKKYRNKESSLWKVFVRWNGSHTYAEKAIAIYNKLKDNE